MQPDKDEKVADIMGNAEAVHPRPPSPPSSPSSTSSSSPQYPPPPRPSPAAITCHLPPSEQESVSGDDGYKPSQPTATEQIHLLYDVNAASTVNATPTQAPCLCHVTEKRNSGKTEERKREIRLKTQWIIQSAEKKNVGLFRRAKSDTQSNKDGKIVDVMGSTSQKAEPPQSSSPPLSPSSSSSSSSSHHYPPPPCPSPAALPYNFGNGSPDPPHSEQQSGSGDNSDNPFQASGWVLSDDSRSPVQETSTYTPPETHDGEPERHEEDEKLNEPVQESREGDEVETDGMGCTGGEGEPDDTS